MGVNSYLVTKQAKDCSGCGACAFACPTGAIEMREDCYGFPYPEIDANKCIQCNKCLRSCHMQVCDDLKHDEPLACYGAIDIDASSLRKSASGGVATALSRFTVDSGGVVFGCVAERDDVHHERLSDDDGLKRAQGSKYVQSDLSRAFLPMKGDLKAGRDVLFIGTPCQCAAMRTLFGKYDNLFTVDLVCEGTPNRRMYRDFLNSIERECGERVTDFRFRDKRRGWSTKNPLVLGKDEMPAGKQPHSYHYYYYYFFTKALTLRESCYSCPYACRGRVADVTIGDLWGAETSGLGYGLKELKAGISCVLVNTEHGLNALDTCELALRSCSFDIIARSNHCLEKPSVCNKEQRSRVLEAYAHDGSDGMMGEYELIFSKTSRIKACVITALPLHVRIFLKRLKTTIRGGAR